MLARRLTTVVVCLASVLTPVVTAADTRLAGRYPHDALARDIDRLVARSGVTPRMRSLLVSQGGELVFERYFNGQGPDDPGNVKSVSKSILSALVGIAIDGGYIDGVDARMKDYFRQELEGVANPEVGAISIEHLLTMQAGLESTSNRNYGAWALSENWIRAALSMPMAAEPGGEMLYSTGNTHLLSAIITRATGKTTLNFARETLAEPLGFELSPWTRDPQGIYFGGNDMVLTPRQLLAFGQLYLDGGRVGGRQVVPEDWVEASLGRHAASPHGNGRYYGYGWWVADLVGHEVPHAWGHGGQFVMLVPDLDLVLVTTSAPHADASANAHANRVFAMLQYLIRDVIEQGESPARFAGQRAGTSMH
jgi:CubicO group peptidase (beta-lactamase class C family)